jgi:hypothetical protein
MRLIAMALGAVTAAAISFVLLAAAAGDPPAWFGPLVLAMDMSLAASSVALGAVFFGRRQPLLGALFLGNLALMLAALAFRAAGAEFPRAVLLGADLYWLALYLVGLAALLRERATPPGRAAGAAGRASVVRSSRPDRR